MSSVSRTLLVLALSTGPSLAGAQAPLPPSAEQRPPPPERLTIVDYGDALAAAYTLRGKAMAWIELVMPDLRVQTPRRIADGANALVVSWPVALQSWTTGRRRASAGLVLFVEPQLATHELSLRGLIGIRAFAASHGLGLVVEGGDLLATDGSGAFAGAGPAIGDRDGLLTAVARRYFVLNTEARWDFTLELSLPTRPLLGLLGVYGT